MPTTSGLIPTEDYGMTWPEHLAYRKKMKRNTMAKKVKLQAYKVYMNSEGTSEYIDGYEPDRSYPWRGLRDTYVENTDRLYQLVINDVEVSMTSSGDSGVLLASCELFNEPNVYRWSRNMSSLREAIKYAGQDIDKAKKLGESKEKVRVKGREMAPTHVDITAEVEVEIPYHNSAPMQERYMEVVGCISTLTQGINNNSILKDSKEVAEAFLKAKVEIEGLATVRSKPTENKGFFHRYFGKNDPSKTPSGANASVQDNIDYLFGLIHEKYERLVTTGEGLQTAKGQLQAQLDLLEQLKVESAEGVKSFGDPSLVPMRVVALDTQIKASAEKYKDRLLKIDGAILATQTTIIALGKDLPAMKTDLTDEMAISGLLTDVGDYQSMYAEIATLVMEVTTSTSEKTHEVIENVLTMQIEDDHTVRYLAETATRGERFANMVIDKSKQLAVKTQNDAKFIEKVAQGKQLESARRSIKKIEGDF